MLFKTGWVQNFSDFFRMPLACKFTQKHNIALWHNFQSFWILEKFNDKQICSMSKGLSKHWRQWNQNSHRNCQAIYICWLYISRGSRKSTNFQLENIVPAEKWWTEWYGWCITNRHFFRDGNPLYSSGWNTCFS